MKIETGKYYRTRDGHKVRIYATDGRDARVHGALELARGWDMHTWSNTGLWCGPSDDSLDIIAEWHEPKLRPWRVEEVPLGAQIRCKGAVIRHVIVGMCGDGIEAGRAFSAGVDWALVYCEHSLDGGKTWHPCGVEE